MISGPNQFNKTVGQSANTRCTLKFEEDEEFSEKPDLLWTCLLYTSDAADE